MEGHTLVLWYSDMCLHRLENLQCESTHRIDGSYPHTTLH
jgi:hypothetical protein